MKAKSTVIGAFSASHIIDGHSACGRLHGHDWTVEATVSTEALPPTGMVVDHAEFHAALMRVLVELEYRHLNDMLPGVPPTPEGVAAYVHERLLLAYPNLTSVAVGIGPYRAVLEWTVR